MSRDEAQLDFVDSCRYGDIDEVKRFLDSGKIDVNEAVGAGRNTALHMASANGHQEIVSLLCANGSLHVPNASENYPLHWAIQNEHAPCVRELIAAFPSKMQLDVALKNEFGFSAVGEAVKSQIPEIIKLVLEHSSVDEDMKRQEEFRSAEEILGRSKARKSSVDGSDAAENEMASVVHSLYLHDREEVVIRIREIGFSKGQLNPLGSDGDARKGYNLWGSSVVMARWISDPYVRGLLDGSSVIELGAGCGLPGIAAAALSDASHVALTDLNEITVQNLKFNAKLNEATFGTKPVDVFALDWSDRSAFPRAQFDVLIGCDISYLMETVNLLVDATKRLLKRGGSVLMVCPTGNRLGLNELIQKLGSDEAGFQLRLSASAPKSFTRNPLQFEASAGADDPNFIIHLGDMMETEYRLLHFEKK